MERWACWIRKAEAQKRDPNLDPNCVGQCQSKKKCSTLVFRKCYNISRSCTSVYIYVHLIKEASCYKVVSVGELAGFDSPIHLCPWYSLRQRLVALLHMCRKILSSNIVSRWKRS